MLDVGSGDGLIGLAGLERVGRRGVVISFDVSEALLEQRRSLAVDRADAARTRFVRASAEDLAGISDASVDVVTTRSVLIYVADTPWALAEFSPVLRPGWRGFAVRADQPPYVPRSGGPLLYGFRVPAVGDLAAKVKARFEEAGFETVHVECHVDIACGSWTQPGFRLLRWSTTRWRNRRVVGFACAIRTAILRLLGPERS